MDQLREFVKSIVPDVVALLCPNLEEKTVTLQGKIGLLESRKDDIDEELRHSGKKRKREVEDWRNNVENIIEEYETLEQEVKQSSRYYHVFKRQKLAEQLERMIEEVTELVDRRDFPSGLFLEVDERVDQLSLTSQPNGQAFQQNLDDIWTSLMDVNIVSIGIYGMGGVGKTTLARHVHDKLKELTFLGDVYWVTVSQEFSISRLQTDIARELKIDITCENDEVKRAAQLFQAFQRKERFVLILDDVWKRIDADKIGITSKMDGYKLVITSRLEEVCRRMYCKKIIKVNTLSEQEALYLFLKTLDCDKLSFAVKVICKKMVNRCGGLPLALVTLAGSMRGVIDIHEWRDASEGLKESCLGQADMEDEVLPILLYSYHRLRDTRLKSCFLYCSLYPEDFRFSKRELIGDFISEGLMEPRLSRQADVDQGHAKLNQLVRACLLESDSYGYLKMHDLIRDMAIWITKDKPTYMVKAGLDLKELPEEQKWTEDYTKDKPRYMVKAGLDLKELPEKQKWTEDLDKVSLMRNSIEEISPGTSPKCPSLSTLILRENPLRLIPDCFFTHMCGLRTLNLSYTSIACLPTSISDLEKLNALLLARCRQLVSVPSLEKLKELRHLDLNGTSIEEVPQGMESLTNLKSISLLCDTLKMIPTGTLHRLTHLQQLVLPKHLDVPIEEFEELKQLEVFQCRLNSVRDLNRLINSRQIDKPHYFYNITIGCSLDEFPILNSARDLKECTIDRKDKIYCIMLLEEEQSTSRLELLEWDFWPSLRSLFTWEAVAAPLQRDTFSCLQSLWICSRDNIKKLFPQSLVHNFHNLRSLTVKNCYGMEEIMEDDNNEGADFTFPMLKSLFLCNLPQLKSICKGKMICDSIESIHLEGIKIIKELPLYLPLLDGQLSGPPRRGAIGLKDLYIEGCGQMKKPFPQSLAHNFRNLESLAVKDCDQMEEIIEDDNNEGPDITLPMLKSLCLRNLPRVMSICKGKMICDSIESIHLEGIKIIKELPLYLPLLNGQLSRPRRRGAIRLKNLFIKGCGKMKKLFPQSLVHNFHNLESLFVTGCVEMEEIIEDDNNEGPDITLPMLKSLCLVNLPRVKSIYKGNMICDSIESIHLEDIGIKELSLLLDGQLSRPPRREAIGLKDLYIEGCGQMKKLFPQSLAHNFRNLESLAVKDCDQMEEIIEDDNNEGADIILPMLYELSLSNLPQVKSICKGKMICDSLESIHLEGIFIKNIKELPLYLPPLDGQLPLSSRLEAIPLKYLGINGCDKMKKLFPQSLAHNFRNLEFLIVENCVQMEEIIEDDNNEGADITLPRLKSLRLRCLPQVKSICKGKMICDSIEKIYFGGITKIKELPLYLPLLDGQLSRPPRLRSIKIYEKGDKEWWESLEWPHHNAKNVLQPVIFFSPLLPEVESDVEFWDPDSDAEWSDASGSGEEESQS